jgi:cell division initiation protein
MKLTPLEIKKQTFERSLRGYDTAEVEAYLTLLSNEWEHLLGRIEELEGRAQELSDKVNHYQKIEQALQETLRTAEVSATQKKSEAEKEAALILQQVEHEADKLLMDARSERLTIREEVQRLVEKREEILMELSSTLDRLQSSVKSSAEQQIILPEIDTQTDVAKKLVKEAPSETIPVNPVGKKPDLTQDDLDDLLDQLDV